MFSFLPEMFGAPRQKWCAGLALAATLALGLALVSQYAYGLRPCELCLLQRIPYGVAIALGVAGALGLRARMVLWLLALCFAIGAALAFFHVGVEMHWWEGFTTCSTSLDVNDYEALRAQILNAPLTRCDAVAWQAFGISMAGYNVLASLILTALAALRAQRM